MTAVAYAHIQITNDGTPVIAETRTKVEEIVLDHLANNWNAAEIHRQQPSLSLAAIHSAFAYYYDHQAEMDKRIEQGIRHVQAIQSQLPSSTARLRLKAKGLLP